MKKALALAVVVLSLGGMTAMMDAEAKRLGGARSSGMQRQQTTQPATQPGAPATPSQAAPAAGTAAAAAAAPAAAAKRSWAGPLTGLAAGLGLAALASYFGFGEALANMMLIALVAFAVLAVVGLVMRNRMARNGTPAVAGAGAGGGNGFGGNPGQAARPGSGTRIGSALAGATAAASSGTGTIPADFDATTFARNATTQFMELQSANDARDLDRLRGYLTPEMFEVVRADVESRGDALQHTEVFGLQAQVVEVVEESDRYLVSVRFTGSTREERSAVPEDLDEIWHLTKPRTGFGGWVVAGIQQVIPNA